MGFHQQHCRAQPPSLHGFLQVPDSVQGPDPELLKLYEATQILAAEGPKSHPVAVLAAKVLAGLTPYLT